MESHWPSAEWLYLHSNNSKPLMVVIAMKVSCKNLTIILNLFVSQILSMPISDSLKRLNK